MIHGLDHSGDANFSSLLKYDTNLDAKIVQIVIEFIRIGEIGK